MLYLTACAATKTKPLPEKVAAMDIDALFKMSRFHCLTVMVCNALEACGTSLPACWKEEKSKAIRKNMLLDYERKKICDFMDQNGIRHMSLKGVVMKELYPGIGTRQMADNDILYDASYRRELAEFMKSSGYSVESLGKGAHDVFMKAPVLNFEMHSSLFGKNNKFYTYYENVESRLVSEPGSRYGYRFTDEDFYIYMTAHEYKHFSAGGTGLRSLLDRYIYLTAKPQLDFDYISEELKKPGISEFEKKAHSLALRVFSNAELPELNADEKKMLEYYLSSGTYGTMENVISNRMIEYNNDGKKVSKWRYMRERLFPGMDFYRENYPFCYKTKILIPAAWAARLFKAAVFNGKKIINEVRIVLRSDK